MSFPFSESVSNLEISKVFNLCNELLVIPRYQRPFSWGEAQLKEMVDDILYSLKHKEPYSFGSVLLAKHIDDNKNRVLYIVDGQQRLCSFMFLIEAIGQWTTNERFAQNLLKLTKKSDSYGNVISSIITYEDFTNVENEKVVSIFLKLLQESGATEEEFSNWLLDEIFLSLNTMHFYDATSKDEIYIYSLKRFISMNTKGLRLIEQEVADARDILLQLESNLLNQK